VSKAGALQAAGVELAVPVPVAYRGLHATPHFSFPLALSKLLP